MAELTDVDVTSGLPTGGTGTVPTLSKTNTVIGAVNETAPASDTASSGLNGRLQRVAQRLSSMIALLPTALGANGGLKIEGVSSGTVVPVTGTITAVTALTNALPAGTNAIGKLAANSGVDIGDVDVTSVSGNVTVVQGTATNLKVDASGVAVPITDNSGSLTVDYATTGSGNATGALRVELPTNGTGVLATVGTVTTLTNLNTIFGSTALDLGSGTGGTRTLRAMLDTTQVASVLDCSTTVTRPSDNADLASGDAYANSTSAPTAGGFTFTSAAGVSGGGGMITDAVIVASDAKLYQGEIWIFDSAVTAINDNAAFACSDADCLLLVGKIPFTLAADVSTTSLAHVSGLNIGYHCVGTANLRFLIRLTAAITAPGSAATLTVRIKGIRS